jgi:hypothetical protein
MWRRMTQGGTDEMKLPKIAAGVLIALVLGLGSAPACARDAGATCAPFQAETTTAESPNLTIKATFPVTGNAQVDALTRAHIDALIEDAQQLYADGDEAPTNIEITFETFRPNKDVVSFLYTQNAYTQGAAYPILSFSSTTFILGKGEMIALTDVLKGDPATMLAPLVRAQLKQVLGEDVYDQLDPDVLTEALSDESTYDTFALSPDGLIIQLQEGLLGPHALGAPRLTITCDQLGTCPWARRR